MWFTRCENGIRRDRFLKFKKPKPTTDWFLPLVKSLTKPSSPSFVVVYVFYFNRSGNKSAKKGTYNLGVKIRNLKVDFKTGGTWRRVRQWTLIMKIYDFFIRLSRLVSVCNNINKNLPSLPFCLYMGVLWLSD